MGLVFPRRETHERDETRGTSGHGPLQGSPIAVVRQSEGRRRKQTERVYPQENLRDFRRRTARTHTDAGPVRAGDQLHSDILVRTRSDVRGVRAVPRVHRVREGDDGHARNEAHVQG